MTHPTRHTPDQRKLLPLLSPRDLDKPLIWSHGRPISGGQFLAQAAALAEQLPASGRVINLCQNRYHFALALAAALLRGQTSLMPPNALPDTLQRLHEAAQHAAGGAYVLADDARLDVGALPLVAVAPAAARAVGRSSDVPLIEAQLDAVQLLTSGSTGVPQPHAKRWGSLVLNVRAGAERLAHDLQRADLEGLTVVATVPPQHSYGLESSVLLALLGGASIDAGRPFYPADVVQALQQVPQPRALVTTPFHLKTLLLAGLALPATELIMSATAALSPQLALQAEQAMQGRLIEIYGCTEAGQVASRRTTAGPVWQTLGDLKVVAQPAATGGEDQFIVSGGHVAEPTPLADVLECVDDRHFRLLGRANDLIHVAGKRSSLAHLNFHLNRIAGVDDGAFWLPDGAGDEVVRPLVFVVAPELTAAQVITALRQNLEPQFVPRKVIHVPSLPHEATGKLTANSLREFALRTLANLQAGTAPGATPQDKATAEPSTSATPAEGHAHWPIAVDHPAFDGHFPGRPVLPGVVLLSLVLETLEQWPAIKSHLMGADAKSLVPPRFDNIKFLTPVGPGDPVDVHLRVQGRVVLFELRLARTDETARWVARGQLSGPTAT